jgi:hypothetical protein
MNIVLNLPSEVESLARALAAAQGEDMEVFLVRQLANSLKAQSASRGLALEESSKDTLVDRLNRFAGMHPVVQFVDDSRDSIYDGRG